MVKGLPVDRRRAALTLGALTAGQGRVAVSLHGRPIAVWCRRLDNSRARGTPWGQRFDHQAMAARCRHPAAAARQSQPPTGDVLRWLIRLKG
jgi:hypothetical protein